MALENCRECNREISDTANSCPHCGYVSRVVQPVQVNQGGGDYEWNGCAMVFFFIGLAWLAMNMLSG